MLASLAPGVGVLSGVIESYQLRNLTQDVAALQASVTTVLNVAAAGAVVSGLGLVTSIAGFAYLARRFDQIDKTINDIAKGVRDIKDWGRGLEKARLHNAISSLRQVSSLDKSNLQHELLLQCKQDFGLLARFYAGRWVDAQEISEIEAIGELYTLSLLGDAMACSGLGLFEEAAVNLAETSAAWTAQARDHAKTILFAGRPDRLMAGEYVELLPAKILVGLLDFAHDSARGMEWLDDFRTAQSQPNRLARVANTLIGDRPAKDDPTEARVGYVRQLHARSHVLAANAAHYRFLSQTGISAVAFEQALATEMTSAGAETLCVYAPPGTDMLVA